MISENFGKSGSFLSRAIVFPEVENDECCRFANLEKICTFARFEKSVSILRICFINNAITYGKENQILLGLS